MLEYPKSVGIDHLLVADAKLPAIINQRAEFPIQDVIKSQTDRIKWHPQSHGEVAQLIERAG